MTTACPTDVVDAPIDVVWALLTEPTGWGGFFDIRNVHVDPPGPARVGQRVQARSGPRWLRLKIGFSFTRVDPADHRLGIDVRLPLGVTVREDLSCAPLGDDRCRVSYRCDFGFPEGWRGALLRAVLGRQLIAGPADSLARLKAAAERRGGGEPITVK